MNGLRIASRQSPTNNVDDSWTCQRTMDGARVQLDYILTDARACVGTIWHDQLIPIGLDHRCVHCVLRWRGVRPSLRNRRLNLKHWMPILDMDGGPSLFQNSLREMLDGNSTISCEVLEHCLLESGKQYSFKPSAMLRNLRNNRRQSVDTVRRKELSFHIQKLHRQELRTWKSTKLSACLCNPSSWKMLRGMLRTPGHEIADQPHADDFAKMLEHLFHGDPAPPMTMPTLTEPPWTMAELKHAISRLKSKKSGDDLGLVAELLKHSPDDFLNALLLVMREVLTSGNVPSSWQRTFFKMLPKTKAAKSVSDFRPIANVRLLYKLFAYLMLGRMEDALEASQPEEQHGFRQGRRIEEHLLTANVCLQKTLAANTPLWIISLDLSKAFDKVDWNALRQHGISEHLIWILQCVYFGQTGVVREHDTDSCGFNVRGGVRQGCVLSPRLFSSVLEMALSSWRAKMEAEGLSLEDGLKPLLDLRFADDILLFCTTLDKTCLLLDELVASLAQVGLTLNLKKTKILTTQSQPPPQLQTHGGVTVDVLDRDSTHKWLGCLLHAGGCHDADIDFHLQAALRTFNANRWILTDRHVSLATRLRYFDTIITPVACFAAGHRTIFFFFSPPLLFSRRRSIDTGLFYWDDFEKGSKQD